MASVVVFVHLCRPVRREKFYRREMEVFLCHKIALSHNQNFFKLNNKTLSHRNILVGQYIFIKKTQPIYLD
jgi:hypothetical protein